MAHALEGYDGLCKHIHGHSYELHVTLIGEPEMDKKSPKLGMVIDFGILKKIVYENIINKFDHAMVLSSKSPEINSKSNKDLFERLVIVPYQPTCENLIIDFADILKQHLPKKVELFSLKLRETANSFVEWFAEDN